MIKKPGHDKEGEAAGSLPEPGVEDAKEAEEQDVEREKTDSLSSEQAKASEAQPGELEEAAKTSPPADTEEYDVQQ